MTTQKRTTVYYQCRDCKVRRAGSDGMLACQECGGEVFRIGYVQRPVTARRPKAGNPFYR